jgi:hypothetical protein
MLAARLLLYPAIRARAQKHSKEVGVLTKKLMSFTWAVAIAAGLLAGSASAQTLDNRVFFTFSGPVELPGVALQPGKYIFRLADPNSGRSIIQVVSADGSRVYGMFFTRHAERLAAPSDAEVRFMESPADTPPAIKTMWYAGEVAGREFVYPKDQARRLAKSSGEPVLTTTAETTTTAQTNTSADARVFPNGQETPVSSDNVVASAPTGTAQFGSAAPNSIAIQPAVTQMASARTSLPRTSSMTPLVMLIGLCLLGFALGVRGWRVGRV